MSHNRMHRAITETINTSTTSRDVRSGVTTSVVEEFAETKVDREVSHSYLKVVK